MAKVYDRLGQFNQSLKANKAAQKIWLNLSKKEPEYLKNIIINYCDIAVTYRLINKLEVALETLYEAYAIIKNNGTDFSNELIILSSDLGVLYEKIKDFPAALNMFEHTLSLIKRSKKSSDHSEISIITNINIGNVHKLNNNLKAAYKSYSNALKITNQNRRFYQHQIIANINLGQVLFELKKYYEAIQVYNKIIPVCERSGSEMDLGFLYILLAEVYLQINKISDYKYAISVGKEKILVASFPNDVLYLNKILARYHLKNNQFKKAVELYNNSIDICIKNKLSYHLTNIYKTLYNIYEKNGDIKNSLIFIKKYVDHKDFINEQERIIFLNVKQQSLIRMQEEIEIIKQKEEKKLLQTKLVHKNREITSKKLHSVSYREFTSKILKALNRVPNKDSNINDIVKLCNHYLKSSSTWKEYLATYNQANPAFMEYMSKIANKLGSTEIRVCTLIHMGLDNYEISEVMSISKRSVEQHRYRIKKKLEIDMNLTQYLLSKSDKAL